MTSQQKLRTPAFQARPYRASLSGTLIVPCRSTSAQPSDHFNEFLPLLESMLELVLLGLVPSAHFGKQLHRAKLVGEFDLATLRVVGLGQPMIGGYFSDGRFQNPHQVLNRLIP